ncbi:MAG TPA: 30S ribosomal protein S20 [Patescibacteria group bacterium]|nr:30S ribosomal protein S20 [Patescibacteria group bacterium]
MPVLKHAKKKMRQDRKRTLQNKQIRVSYRALLKKAKQKPTKETISQAFSSLDKAAKKNVIHKNKAARLKSSLSKLLPSTNVVATKTAEKKTAKTTKKAASK